MKRRSFIRRMIFAGLATVFLDLPLPKEEAYVLVSETWDYDGAVYYDYAHDELYFVWQAPT